MIVWMPSSTKLVLLPVFVLCRHKVECHDLPVGKVGGHFVENASLSCAVHIWRQVHTKLGCGMALAPIRLQGLGPSNSSSSRSLCLKLQKFNHISLGQSSTERGWGDMRMTGGPSKSRSSSEGPMFINTKPVGVRATTNWCGPLGGARWPLLRCLSLKGFIWGFRGGGPVRELSPRSSMRKWHSWQCPKIGNCSKTQYCRDMPCPLSACTLNSGFFWLKGVLH